MPVRVIFITQEDPFYLATSLRYILEHLPSATEVVAAVVLSGSPFGAKHSFFGKVQRIHEVFGLRFLWHYGWRFLRAKLNPSGSVTDSSAPVTSRS